MSGTTDSRSEALRASPRMFDNRLLDALSRVHPAVPVLIFVPAIAVLFVFALRVRGAGVVIGLFVGGWLFWTLAEYWIHRVVFHFEPDNDLGRRLHWIIHGVHHDHPNDPLRLVMPPSVSMPLGAAFFWLFVAALGMDSALAFGSGFFAGYLVYDMVHYHVHHHRPKTRAGKLLRELHMRHHFQDHTNGFGISAPFWDAVFRTSLRRQRTT